MNCWIGIMVLNVSLLLLHLLVQSGSGRRYGVPKSSCNHMLPDLTETNGHGTVLNRTESPWFIKVYKRDVGLVNEYEPGIGTQSLVVEISGPKYKGFLLQARTLAGYSRRVGEFVTPLGRGARFLACDGKKHTAVTHADPRFKRNVWFTWKPPRISQGPIQFVATVVLDRKQVWANVRSDYIYPKLKDNKIDTRFCGRGLGCIHFGAYGCVNDNSCEYAAAWKCVHESVLVEMVGNDNRSYSETARSRRKPSSHGIGIVPHGNQIENGSVSCVLGRDFYWHSKKRRAPDERSLVQLVPLGTNKVLPVTMHNTDNRFLCRFVRQDVDTFDNFNFYISKGNGVLSIIRDLSPIRLCSHPHLYVNLPRLNHSAGNTANYLHFAIVFHIFCMLYFCI